jgi:hypothetical protein
LVPNQCPNLPLHERSQALALAVAAPHDVGIHAQCESGIGVAELLHHIGRFPSDREHDGSDANDRRHPTNDRESRLALLKADGRSARLAKPGSPWAGKRYTEEKLARARERFPVHADVADAHAEDIAVAWSDEVVNPYELDRITRRALRKAGRLT